LTKLLQNKSIIEKIKNSILDTNEKKNGWDHGSRSHSGKYCYGRTPLATFLETRHLAQAKMLDEIQPTALAVVR
jgi:hypothetical protein